MLTQFLTNPIITQIPPPLYEFRQPLGHYYPILFPLVPTTLARATSVASFCSLVHTMWSKAGLGATDLPVQLTESQGFSSAFQCLLRSTWGIPKQMQLISICKVSTVAEVRATQKGQI